MDRQAWEDPAVFECHRETMHAAWGAYPDADAARAGQRDRSPYRVSLDGDW